MIVLGGPFPRDTGRGVGGAGAGRGRRVQYWEWGENNSVSPLIDPTQSNRWDDFGCLNWKFIINGCLQMKYKPLVEISVDSFVFFLLFDNSIN